MPAERKRSNNSAGMDSRIFPMEGAESRTPMAWQQRNLNYQQQQQLQQQQQQQQHHQQQQQQQHQQQQQAQQVYHTNTISYVERERPQRVSNSSHPNPQRVSEEVQTTGRGRRSSSSTATSSSSSTERASKNSRPVHSAPPPLPAYQAYPQHPQAPGTWDGEPCPIHHLTMIAPQVMPPPQVQMMMPPVATLPRRPPAYDKNIVMLLPPMMRPRPLVRPAVEGPPEPLPVRDPKAMTLPRKEGSASSEKSLVKDTGSCQGHTVVLWFIISVITIGVLLGAVLRFVMG